MLPLHQSAVYGLSVRATEAAPPESYRPTKPPIYAYVQIVSALTGRGALSIQGLPIYIYVQIVSSTPSELTGTIDLPIYIYA